MTGARILRRALGSGTLATATSVAALALVARAEGKGLAQPLNATSHWRYGDRAARVREPELARTGVGLATHATATVFWATFFEAWLTSRPARGVSALAGCAATVALGAAIVDYTVTPHRFTPGWELVLSKRGMGVVYAAMAAGFAAAALARGAV